MRKRIRQLGDRPLRGSPLEATMFRLPVRQYRVYVQPGQEYEEANFGHVHREIELDPATTAFVTLDLWDMGWKKEPLAPDLGRDAEYHFIGLGHRGTLDRGHLGHDRCYRASLFALVRRGILV